MRRHTADERILGWRNRLPRNPSLGISSWFAGALDTTIEHLGGGQITVTGPAISSFAQYGGYEPGLMRFGLLPGATCRVRGGPPASQHAIVYHNGVTWVVAARVGPGLVTIPPTATAITAYRIYLPAPGTLTIDRPGIFRHDTPPDWWEPGPI